jgi:RimJ/RimL family protein N-acetyltransferase
LNGYIKHFRIRFIIEQKGEMLMERKVILRDLEDTDVQDRYNWSLDREVTKFLVTPEKYPPFTIDETYQWISICKSHGIGYYQKAIITEDGTHIGWVDLKNFDKVNKNAELGITIGNKNYWGKGYGRLAIEEMLEIGFKEFVLEKIWLRVDCDNIKAIKSYEKCGFIREGIMRKDRLREGKYISRIRYSILKEEFINENISKQ